MQKKYIRLLGFWYRKLTVAGCASIIDSGAARPLTAVTLSPATEPETARSNTMAADLNSIAQQAVDMAIY